MPHIVVEYSANLAGALDVAALLRTLHEAAVGTGVFPHGAARTRAARRDEYVIADGHPDNAFVHVAMRIGHGRDAATRKRAAQAVFDALCAATESVFAARPLGLSVELDEIDPDTSFKKNNLHDYVKAREQDSGASA